MTATNTIDSATPSIRPMAATDWPRVAAIYEAGIATGNATFETAAPAWNDWDAGHLTDHRLVAVHGDGRGIGKALLDALIASSEAAGIWTVQTGIFPENTASIALHERCGFRVIGRRERIGQLAGAWRDTLSLERRSTVVGTPGV